MLLIRGRSGCKGDRDDQRRMLDCFPEHKMGPPQIKYPAPARSHVESYEDSMRWAGVEDVFT